MKTRPLGNTGIEVSRLGFGASALGGTFGPVDEADAIAAVHAALDCGINHFDVAPAYGGTRAETLLGKALRGIPRTHYHLATKVGKHTNPARYGDDVFDYSRERIRRSLDESAARLGVDYFDIIHLHDMEYQSGRHVAQALTEGFEAVTELKHEGRTRAVGFGMYSMDLWHRVLETHPPDVALVHNHHALHDTRLLELLPIARAKGVGIINGSPFGSGLLTPRGPADWYPATAAQRAVFRAAADHCESRGVPLVRLALQFSCQHPDIPTTLFSADCADTVRRNVADVEEPFDPQLAAEVREILRPVTDIDWFP